MSRLDKIRERHDALPVYGNGKAVICPRNHADLCEAHLHRGELLDMLDAAEKQNKEYKEAWSINVYSKRIDELEAQLAEIAALHVYNSGDEMIGIVDDFVALDELRAILEQES